MEDDSCKKHKKYIEILCKLCLSIEPVASARISSCIVYKNEIVSFGINQRKTHPFQSKYSKNEQAICLHAETDAIKNSLRVLSLKELSKSTLYISRMKYDSENLNNMVPGLAKPCIGCMKAIATFNIRNVVYTENNQGYSFLS